MENSKRIVFNLIWRFAERTGAQIITFLVTLVIARILEPEDYGIIALIMVFISILQVFVDSGLGNALIQKKNADDLDFSTVFFTNIVFCLCLYLLMFFMAPLIARFYGNESLVLYIRVLSIIILISGVKNVQQAYVSRNMLFKKFFFSTLGGTIISCAIGIIMAVKGFGVWALISQQLLNLSIDTLILWLTVKWRPKLEFSFIRLKELFSFGSKLLISALIYTVEDNIRQLIIGKVYAPSELAQYNRGKQIPSIVITNINSSIDSVLLPAMSREQDNSIRVKEMTRRAIKVSTYVIAPLMIGLVFTAETFVKLILTDKWLPSVFFLRIFCITFIFYPIHTANLNAIKSLGRSDLFLKLEIYKNIVNIIALVSTMFISVDAIAYSLLFTSVISQVINSGPNKKLLEYSYLEQIKDIMPIILIAVFMGVCIYPIKFLELPLLIILVIQVIVGILIYILASKIFKLDSYHYIVEMIKSIIKPKHNKE